MRRRIARKSLLCAAVWASACLAQQATRTVTGTVVNSITSQPVKRALVQLNGPRQESVFTGPDGRFQFTNIPEGTVFITAQRPGFLPPNMPFPGMSLGAGVNGYLNVTANGANDFRIALMPEASLEGYIVDRDDQPVERVPVQIFIAQIAQGRKRWLPSNMISTDEDGYYRIDNLPPGPVLVKASQSPVMQVGGGPPTEAYASVFYPGSPDMGGAQTINLTAGEKTRADFTVPVVKTFQVTGVMKGLEPGVFVGCTTETDDGQETMAGYLQYDPNSGHFRIEQVPKGSWTYNCQSNDQQGHSFYGDFHITVADANVEGLTVQMQTLPDIPVQISSPSSSDTTPQNQSTAQVRLTPVSANMMQEYWSGQAGGNLSPGAMPAALRGVRPGRYRVTVQTNGQGCVESLSSGSTDLDHDPLTVGEGGSAQPIVVQLRNDCASITGKITGEGLQGKSLILLGDSVSIEPLIAPAQGGAFSFMSLSPGSYRLYLLANPETVEYANPDVMRSYSAEEITLAPNQKLEMTLDGSGRSTQ